MGQRASFSTKLGVIAATAGSSIGLGNIWRFPYETGQNGGAAFILIYIICVLVLAMPVMMAEFIIGRGSRTNASHAFNKLAPGSWWKIIGYICISAPVIIVGFYFVISGWTLEYVIQSLTPGSMIQQSAEAYSTEFNRFIASPLKPLVWVILFILINHVILMRGVNSGIEKAANILMPVLFLILIIFCIRSIFLPGFSEGMNFLFKPDFSKITPNVVLRAMGQAFFSMSVGMGILITTPHTIQKKRILHGLPQPSRLSTPSWPYSPASSFSLRYLHSASALLRDLSLSLSPCPIFLHRCNWGGYGRHCFSFSYRWRLLPRPYR